MDELVFALMSDGSFDRALMPIIRWTLLEAGVSSSIRGEWADLGRLPHPPRRLQERIRAVMELYPCDVLFIHRDAEAQTLELRLAEIARGVSAARKGASVPPDVPVVPVRMTEAWLLFDEPAIRAAADNPRGTDPLQIPPKSTWEKLPNPKARLREALESASGRAGRRRRAFDAGAAAALISGRVESFAPLRGLAAFDRFEAAARKAVASGGWADAPRTE